MITPILIAILVVVIVAVFLAERIQAARVQACARLAIS